MSKLIGKVFLFIGILAAFTACNNNPFIKNQTEGQDLVYTSSDDISQVVSALVEISQIRRGGYVVILPVEENIGKEAKDLQKRFSQNTIPGVHIFEFKPDSIILKTDSLAIENAGIVCLLGGVSRDLLKLEEYSKINSYLEKTRENGGVVAIRE